MKVKSGTENKQVVVGLSGGVDSAVTAALLLEAGFAVHGVVLQLWQTPAAAVAHNPAADAQLVAATLDIPLTVLDLRQRFRSDVVLPFIDAYAQGITPNPCVLCNPTLKFAALLEAADALGAHWIATGHYARVTHPAPDEAHLLRARSHRRDQSYMLYRLDQRILRRLRLPLGEFADKAQVRELARRFALPSAEQRDSQDLCFLNGGDYRPLLQQLRPTVFEPGPILDEAGTQLGRHQGLPRYTVGQRSGLGLAHREKLYVLQLRTTDHALIVGPAERLDRKTCQLEQVTFPQGNAPANPFTAEVRIRYRAPLTPATITLLNDNCATVTFTVPQRAVAPGQSIVFYQDEEVLGGGMISRIRPSEE